MDEIRVLKTLNLYLHFVSKSASHSGYFSFLYTWFVNPDLWGVPVSDYIDYS